MMLLIYQRTKKRETGRAGNEPDTVDGFVCYTLQASQEGLDCKYHFSGFREKKSHGNMERRAVSACWRNQELPSS